MAFKSLYRFVIPGFFLGYSAVYLSAVAGPMQYALGSWALEGKSWADGSATSSFDDVFARMAPYQLPAIDLAGFLRFELFGELKPGAVQGRNGYLFAEADIIFDHHIQDRVAYALDRVAGVKAELDRRGVDLVLIPLPTKMDVERDHHDYAAAAQAGEDAYAAFLEGVSSIDVRVVDARPSWLEADDDLLTHRTDQHWTVYGAGIVAKNVASFIDPEPPTGRVSLLPIVRTLAFQGDLASFVGSQDVSAAVGFPAEVIRPIQAIYSDEIADGPAKYMLVGTSESVDTRWSFQSQLEGALQEKVENRAMSGVGPIYPMLAVLSQMTEETPKIVLWEFPVGSIFKDAELYAKLE